jgi:D-lactate dehydrogenase
MRHIVTWVLSFQRSFSFCLSLEHLSCHTASTLHHLPPRCSLRVAFFDTHPFEREYFNALNMSMGQELTYFEPRLTRETARLAQGFPVVCSFANDKLDRLAIGVLKECGVKLIALRSAGFNHVDLAAAHAAGLRVVRVPAYSPYAVAEHAVTLILALNRKIHRAYSRVREGNFSLGGLVGFDLHGKTVGVVGTGRIGAAFASIMRGFGCRVLAYDLVTNPELEGPLQVKYVDLPELYANSDVISLHVPLTPKTRHLIDAAALAQMKSNAMIINTGRGALIDTAALISALKSGTIGFAGLDVYEEEEGIFFEDLSNTVLQDDQLARLLTFPNVLVTAHQGFLTKEALGNIAETTLENIRDFELGKPLKNEVKLFG